MSSSNNTDSLTSWFVRRHTAAEADAKQKAQDKEKQAKEKERQEKEQQQQKARQRQKEKEAAASEQPGCAERKPLLQKAAAAAAVVQPDRKGNKPADASGTALPERQQKRQRRRRDSSGSSSDGGSDSEDAAQPQRGAGRREPEAQQGGAAAEGGDDADDAATARRRAQDEEAENRPRVVAYSDSDSDVESHFKRVAHHLLPPSKEQVEAEAAAEAAAAAAAAEEAAAAARLRAPLRRVGRAAAGTAGALVPHLTPGLAARAGGLLLLSHARPRTAQAVSALGLAAPLLSAAAGRAGLSLGGALPGPLAAAGQELGQVGKAALALAAVRLLHGAAARRRRRRRQRRSQQQGAVGEDAVPVAPPLGTSTGRLLRRKSSVNLAALLACDDLTAVIAARNPQTAAEWAAVYSTEMQEMRRMLEENGVALPADRFDASNAELFRFAKGCGLLQAKTAEARGAALEAAFSRVVHTCDWAARHRFMTDRELRRWDRLVAWKAHDTSGRPILLARVGRAMQLVRPERYEEFTNALVSLVHRSLGSRMAAGGGAAEQMVVVLDCRGASSMSMTRHMGLLKRFAVTMTHHFPDRLHRLYLLELPLLLRWALHGVQPLLHPATRAKLALSSMSDPDLPVTVAFLTKRRSTGTPLKRSMSNLSFQSSGDSTPAPLSPQPSHLAAIAAGLPAVAAAAAGAAAALGSAAQQQQQQAVPSVAVEGEEEVPHTPPPTLKAPHSPRNVSTAASAERRRQLALVAHHARQRHSLDHEEQAQQAQHGRGVAHHARAHAHSHDHPQQAAAASPPRAAGASQLDPPPSPFASRSQHLQQAAWAAAEQAVLGSAATAAEPPAAAAGAPGAAPQAAAAASAAAGPSSHAIPWSPGMASPGGRLSRDSSVGEEELVPAAQAAGALQAAAGAAAAAGPAPQQQPAATPEAAAAPDGSTRSSGAASLPGWSGLVAALLPAALRGSSTPAPSSAAAGEQAEPLRRRRSLLAHRVPSLGFSSRDHSPATPRSARRRGGLVDLPDRARPTPRSALALTPRKSSLRRSSSTESVGGGRREPLGSHPLRRQSSVSWAEELESIKEITAAECLEAWHGSPLRSRLAAAGQYPTAVLTACLLMTAVAVLLQRLLFGAAL